MDILVTGGAGFIGSNFLNMLVPRHPEHRFINVDKLTYAANLENLTAIAQKPNYALERVDIADPQAVRALFAKYGGGNTRGALMVVHFAAESHVDRSIHAPDEFIATNITGTFNLLEAFRALPAGVGKLFHHVSTDEVYGSLGPSGLFTETTAYDPSSPYSASKAASDHLVRAYHRTYKLPTKLTNCSNNYGPFQFPEKLIPLMILNAAERKPLPVYGAGSNVRDWLHVEDHCEAIWAVIQKGKVGETYNVGGRNEKKNLDVVHTICDLVAEAQKVDPKSLRELIAFVPDRPGHDLRYAIDADKVVAECGWKPKHNFESGIRHTVRWYLEHTSWVNGVRSGDYRKWLETNYAARGGAT